MGALTPYEELERRRAVWALHGLGWLFACLAIYEFARFFPWLVYTQIYDLPRDTTLMWKIRAYVHIFLIRNQSAMMAAAAFAAFWTAKRLEAPGCCQRWAKIPGTVVAAFARWLFPGLAVIVFWHYMKALKAPYPMSVFWHSIDWFWLLLSVPCLFLGLSVLSAMRRMGQSTGMAARNENDTKRHRAVWALYGLGWLFMCLAVLEFAKFLPGYYPYNFGSPLRYFGGYIPYLASAAPALKIVLPYLFTVSRILVMAAAAFATFLAAKRLGCRQRWANVQGMAVAVFAILPLPAATLVWVVRIWRSVQNFGTAQHILQYDLPIWISVYFFWLLVSAPCLVLGASVFFALCRLKPGGAPK